MLTLDHHYPELFAEAAQRCRALFHPVADRATVTPASAKLLSGEHLSDRQAGKTAVSPPI